MNININHIANKAIIDLLSEEIVKKKIKLSNKERLGYRIAADKIKPGEDQKFYNTIKRMIGNRTIYEAGLDHSDKKINDTTFFITMLTDGDENINSFINILSTKNKVGRLVVKYVGGYGGSGGEDYSITLLDDAMQEQVIKKIQLPPSEEMLFKLKYKAGRGLFKENDFEVYYDDGQLKFVQVSNLEKLKGILKALNMVYQADDVEFQKFLKNGMAYFILDNENGIIAIIRLADSKIIDSNNKAIDKDNPELYNKICKILEQVFEIDE